jgi:hypothetical protein
MEVDRDIIKELVEFCDERYLYYSGIKSWKLVKDFRYIEDILKELLEGADLIPEEKLPKD